jgi:hypothetical protein
VRLIHGSEPNQARHRRIGYAIRYIPTAIHQITGVPDSATLVRGTDRFGHFIHEPRPVCEFDPETVAFHASVMESNTAILYRGSEQRPRPGTARIRS